MAIPPSLTRISRLYFRPKTTVASSPVPFAASSHVTFLSPSKSSFSLPPSSSPPTLNFCAAYAPRAQLFASRRAEASLPSHRCRRLTRVFGPLPGNLPGSEPTELPSAPISSEPGFEDFVKRKLPMDEPKTKEMHAFDSDNYIQPDESNPPPNAKAGAEIGECKRRVASDGVFDGRNVFVKMDIPAKKVKLSKCLKKAPNGEPCILTRGGVLPPKWDGSSGTVVLVNKPKGDFVFNL